MRFDLVDLRLFDATLRTGSISAGAAASNMALASASARLSGMEDALGVSLLQRGRRGVTPTAAGRSLLQHARSITGQVERMRGDMLAFSHGLKGEIRMLSNTAGLVDVVPATLQRFLSHNPGVDVDLEEMTSAEIVDAVANGAAEFGVIADSTDIAQLQVRTLRNDRLVAITAVDHPLAGQQEISFAELLDEPFVGLSAGALHEHLTQHAARLGRRIACRVRLSNFSSVARLVRAGVGVSILPQAALEDHQAGLAKIELSDPWADRRLLVCVRRFTDLSRHASALISELQRSE
jgi:DNA-binding transcriptional LysR family regulator